ncbi:prolyl 3-hydroxylase OGFOD1 isoform X3 [Hippopotamus amphibius kiboko]|uniref:prolyl 3-hydroxylase OGFOD1 isoform X3 n=1 Tax=Hippopotamus amphibius kiboko TaxID=575201 RepID=UPI0025948AE0|nr:prolyl 3-hydroxylase OGFOD1 isoform X3 [Hippopotamus amphibius kiboko]XP_057566609.1 prolyl 3-hydroxylase OGFOD1 isoform X3 [Hippopotamus amphibius kiboko]XP_057566610.1 prolyl 3-hydroxylase OGFOD1 isoform X3 [Hippopotamus amphibius kiboko]
MSGKRPAEPGPGRTGKKGKKEVMARFSDAVTEETLKKQVAEAWSRRTPFRHEAIVMDMDPFLHCVIPNFIQSENFLEGLQKELLNLDFHEKYNDLYKFQQSDDLKKRREPHICALRKILFEHFRAWLSDISKIDLESTIDMSCAKYEFSGNSRHTDIKCSQTSAAHGPCSDITVCSTTADALLCHDDELEGRRIAFILYLVPPWDRSLGGTLDLYNIDEHFQPKQIVKSLIPSWNTLVFFEVSPVSFHQVSEVLSEEKSRLSISGWFHGPSLTRPPTYFEPLVPRSPHIPQDHEILYDWINPTYLDMEYQVQIQEEFEESSEILLKEFLKPEKFAEVCEALEKGGVEWSSRGPPNKRFYEKAEESKLPDILKDCMALFRSEAIFLLLSNFTGLKLHFLAPSEEDELEDKKEGDAASAAANTEEGTSHSSSEPENSQATAVRDSSQQSTEQTDPEPEEDDSKQESSVPMCQGELRHWKTGHYTLIHDNSKTEFALDLLLYCGCEGWEPEYGGFTSYIAKGEDEESTEICV